MPRVVDELVITDVNFTEPLEIVVRGFRYDSRWGRVKAAWKVLRGHEVAKPVYLVGNIFHKDTTINHNGVVSRKWEE